MVYSYHYTKRASTEELDEYEKIIYMLLYQRIRKNKTKI